MPRKNLTINVGNDIKINVDQRSTPFIPPVTVNGGSVTYTLPIAMEGEIIRELTEDQFVKVCHILLDEVLRECYRKTTVED